MKWIAVGERLPKSKRRVLIWVKQYFDKRIIIESNRFFWNLGKWSWQREEGRSYAPELITHWMPLPEPPKGE